MDVREGGYGDPKGVRSELPSGARQPGGEGARSLVAEASSASQPARRTDHRTLEERTLARIEKGALKEGRTIVFCDQSGFYLLPMVVRTYAPVGKTPILKENLTRDHLSAMSGVTLEGKLYMIEQEKAFNVQGRGCGTLSKASHASNSGQAVGGLGWLSDPSRRRGQGLSGERGGSPSATGATARLRSGSQSRRGSVEAPQVRGAKEPLLPEPLRVEG